MKHVGVLMIYSILLMYTFCAFVGLSNKLGKLLFLFFASTITIHYLCMKIH